MNVNIQIWIAFLLSDGPMAYRMRAITTSVDSEYLLTRVLTPMSGRFLHLERGQKRHFLTPSPSPSILNGP